MKHKVLTVFLSIILVIIVINYISLPVLADSASCISGKCKCDCAGISCTCTGEDGNCTCACSDGHLQNCTDNSTGGDTDGDDEGDPEDGDGNPFDAWW